MTVDLMSHPALVEWMKPSAIDTRTLWRWLEPRACILAACYWWPNLPESDLRGLMRLHAKQIADANPGLSGFITSDPELYDIAHQVLEEAIEGMWLQHDATHGRMVAAATEALRAGGDRQAVLGATLPVARSSLPLPPPWLVQDAIEKAAREFRFETKFWQRRRQVG